MTNTNRRLTAIATGQLGLVSRGQANEVGVTDRQLRSRVTSGTLDRIGPHTYRLSGAQRGAREELTALMLDIGDPVFASGPAAAALHGFDGFTLTAPFDVVILRDRNVQRIGHRIHTTIDLDLIDRSTVDEIRCTSAARTLIDLARTADHQALMIAYDSGLRDGWFSEDLLHRRIVALRNRGRPGIAKLLEAIEEREVGRGGHSYLARRFLLLMAGAGIETPLTQQVLTRAADRLVRVDFRFPGTNIVVETLGYRYHRTTTQITRDAERMNALVADGFRVFQFTYDQVTDEPGDVVATVRSALGLPVTA